jgi:hypothetical protein
MEENNIEIFRGRDICPSDNGSYTFHFTYEHDPSQIGEPSDRLAPLALASASVIDLTPTST